MERREVGSMSEELVEEWPPLCGSSGISIAECTVGVAYKEEIDSQLSVAYLDAPVSRSTNGLPPSHLRSISRSLRGSDISNDSPDVDTSLYFFGASQRVATLLTTSTA